MYKKILIIIFLSITITSCFGGIEKQGSVLGYSRGVVKTEGGSFRIGNLPSYWKKKGIDYRAILFVNQKDQSTITVDSWCKRAAGDASLKTLTDDLLRGITDLETGDSYEFSPSNRAALLTEGTGKVDGRDIYISTYVFKMNACVFDFVYVTFPDELEYLPDFKKMIEGFEFIKGPKLL